MSPKGLEDDGELGGAQLGLLTRLLPLAVIISAIVLFASELMTTLSSRHTAARSSSNSRRPTATAMR